MSRINLFVSPEINTPSYYHYCFIEDLTKVLNANLFIAGQPANVNSNSINVFFVLASRLFQNTEWFKSIKGTKVIIEHDAYLNFMSDSPYYQCRTNFYHSIGYDILVSSGKITTEKQLQEGLPAKWVSKGADKKFLTYSNKKSGKLGYFGSSWGDIHRNNSQQFSYYKSRYEMANIIGSKIDSLTTSVLDFPITVSTYSGIFLNDATMEEPMAKHFEVSALGVIPIRDHLDELYELGYDDTSMIMYRSNNELLDMISNLQDNPTLLLNMQEKTREIARMHTREVKAHEIRNIIEKFT